MAEKLSLNELPTEILEIIFEFLDPKSTLVMTETCTTFNSIVTNSERLSKKLTLYLRYPQDLHGFADSILNSNRRYRHLQIVKSRDREVSNPAITHRLFPSLAATVRNLKIDWSNAMRPREASLFEIINRRRVVGEHFFPDHARFDAAAQALATAREDIYKEFIHLIRYFCSVQSISLFNVHLEKGRQPTEPTINFPQLKELKVAQCDAFCFDILLGCNNLKKIEVIDPYWNTRNQGIDTFESFLISQRSLKELKLKNFQYPRLFQVDRTEGITFKLEKLTLKSVYFANKEIANNFFKTQNELKSIDFQLHNEKIRNPDGMWYHNILKTIITNSHYHLESVKLEKVRYRIDDCNFISRIVNPNVKVLSFSVSAEDKSSELFKTFIRMFPNLEAISFKAEESEEPDSGICFDEGTVLEGVKSLVITNSSVRSLVNVYAGSLTNFEYVPGKTGEFIDDLFGGFFHRHRNIRNLVIGSRSERSYFFVSYNLCQLIVNFLSQLESITILNFGEVNKSVKLLCHLPKLKSLTLSTEDYQQFTAKTKVECTRNELKLIHVDLPRCRQVIFQH